MERIFAGLQWDILLLYLKSVGEQLQRLEEVFRRLRMANLKLKPRKCFFFKEKVAYLGHIISHEGIATDPDKVKAVNDWPTPANVRDVSSFLGLASYYRRYIKGFANIARPLHQMMEKDHPFNWTVECEQAS